ncbi:protein-S-isoprenylcysteine O-methyltransferase Ste14 [Alicyclobacillus tengchongensis]|uniref:Protein-S-isoprenylcysteine O-methyltransferase Ste14 n=1 Tax=Alicyclobacillus tolerans TaxID=90970 RepID=A0ABT9LTU2_9BACL|nr:protein-S-isoprenylcysteine O-methyltransferase Ste14 [Alicyclobacillus tengchongensis]
MKVEESILFAHIGEAYGPYRQRTWRLLPWIY